MKLTTKDMRSVTINFHIFQYPGVDDYRTLDECILQKALKHGKIFIEKIYDDDYTKRRENLISFIGLRATATNQDIIDAINEIIN